MADEPYGECRSCGEPVIWLTNNHTGRKAPIDQEETPDGSGNVVIDVNAGTYRVVSGTERHMLQQTGHSLYTNHFQTCKDQERWRDRNERRHATRHAR